MFLRLFASGGVRYSKTVASLLHEPRENDNRKYRTRTPPLLNYVLLVYANVFLINCRFEINGRVELLVTSG